MMIHRVITGILSVLLQDAEEKGTAIPFIFKAFRKTIMRSRRASSAKQRSSAPGFRRTRCFSRYLV